MEKLQEAVNFLLTIYSGSVPDVAVIVTAQAEEDKDTLIKYLENVKAYTDRVIERIK